ncbi:hypothetical protein VdG1_00736 [Verticillium dahliae VDG1]|nr:hypothetical protein VdG1_00736 [Verticillium dahliae VDG1]
MAPTPARHTSNPPSGTHPAPPRPTFLEATADANTFHDTQAGEAFGPPVHVELHWDCNNEATGLTGRGQRVEWVVPASFKDGREHVVYLEMACNGMFGKGPGRPIFENNAGGDSI